MKWICGDIDYEKALRKSNLLPTLYFIVLKDILLLKNILNNQYRLLKSNAQVKLVTNALLQSAKGHPTSKKHLK